MRNLLVALILLCLSTSVWAAKPEQPINLRFVQTAPIARLTAISGSNQYRLILGQVSPYVTYYAQRPNRSSGLAQLANFLKAWRVGESSFAKIPPNATLFAGAINDRANSADTFQVVTLSHPIYDQKKNELEYTVTPVSGQNFLLKSYNYRELMLVIN